ncbi:MAG: cupin domain-containing protein [Solirubrobacterales bacterium]
METPGRAIDRVDAEGYEPFIVDGEQVGEIRWLRTTQDQASTALEVGLWRSDPATYDYLFVVDETFHVIEGAVTIELPETDERLELKAGDIAFFQAGTPSVWTITKPFKKFVITPPS